jgi:ComF family protein
MSLTAKIVQQTVKHLLDFVYPPQCLACHSRIDVARDYLCPQCWQSLIPAEPASLYLGEQNPLLYSIALYDLDSISQALIHAFKYREIKSLARPLGEALAVSSPVMQTLEALVAVPLHKIRFRERGYNQAELLARELAAILDIPVLKRALIRTRYTSPQARMNREQRQKNVAGVFRVIDAESVTDKRIGLVDDVYTTGQTMNSCGRELRHAGAGSVIGLSILRVSDTIDIS